MPTVVVSAAQQKADAEAAEVQKYLETLLKPTGDDIELAIQLVCSGLEKSKNGVKRT